MLLDYEGCYWIMRVLLDYEGCYWIMRGVIGL